MIHYAEEWDSGGAFRRHVRSDDFWPILVVIDLSAEEPQVAISDVSTKHGLEALLALRKAPDPDKDAGTSREGSG